MNSGIGSSQGGFFHDGSEPMNSGIGSSQGGFFHDGSPSMFSRLTEDSAGRDVFEALCVLPGYRCVVGRRASWAQPCGCARPSGALEYVRLGVQFDDHPLAGSHQRSA